MFGIALGWPQYLLLGVIALLAVGYAANWALTRGDEDSEPETENLVDVVFQRAGEDGTAEETTRVERVVEEDGAIEFPQPNVQTANFGLVEEFVRFYQRRRKQRKLARRGYVKWVLAGQTYARPRFVKPETKGGGIPEYEHDGVTYLFPKGAAAADEATGMWTFVHKEGDADPVNLRDPLRTSIPGDTLKEYLTLRVSSNPPGFLDSLNINPRKALMLTMAAIAVLAVLRRGV